MTTRSEPQGGAKLLIDLGPLLVFFLVNFLAPVPPLLKIFVATGAFMVAIVAAMLFSAIRYRRISPLLWFSGVMVVILGGLTIWLHDRTFIQMKPTVYYGLVAGLLGFGLVDRPALASAGAGQHLSRPRRGGLAQADSQLGDLLRLHGRAERGGVAQQLDGISGSDSRSGARCPSPSCSQRPTSRCCSGTG